MNRAEITDKIKEMIQEGLGVDQVELSADLQKDYEIDSIGVMDFIMTVEEEFGVQFDDGDLEKMKTPEDVIEHLEQLLN